MPTSTKRFSILVAHPWMGKGGSEATTMWVLQALQHDFEVTFVTAGPVDFDQFNLIYGSAVDSKRIKIKRAPIIPGIRKGTQLVALQHAIFHRFCNKIGSQFDLCISGYNFVTFGKPAIQLVGDLSFSEELRQKFYVQGFQKLTHRNTLLRAVYLKLKKMVWNTDYSFFLGDAVVANSSWTAANLQRFCHLKSQVVFPPVKVPANKDFSARSNGYGFFYIGRISPEKEIEKIISILDKVRGHGFPVTLELAGNSGATAYEKLILSQASEKAWIKDLGYLSGEEKEAAFARNSYGIQACQCEAFGIAAAEMASRGCLPLVAAGSGSAEIVAFPELQYDSVDDAVKKIIKLLEFPKLTDNLRNQVTLGTKRFSTESFVLNLREIVDRMLPQEKVRRNNVAKRRGRSVVI
jgi:glycosyltransferase involved in cell wall biosynthesis